MSQTDLFLMAVRRRRFFSLFLKLCRLTPCGQDPERTPRCNVDAKLSRLRAPPTIFAQSGWSRDEEPLRQSSANSPVTHGKEP